MRTAVLLAKQHDGEWVLIHGPDVPLQEQVKDFRAVHGTAAHGEFCELYYQESDGMRRTLYLRSPEQHEEHKKNIAEATEANRKVVEADARRELTYRHTERAKRNEAEALALGLNKPAPVSDKDSGEMLALSAREIVERDRQKKLAAEKSAAESESTAAIALAAPANSELEEEALTAKAMIQRQADMKAASTAKADIDAATAEPAAPAIVPPQPAVAPIEPLTPSASRTIPPPPLALPTK